MASNVLPGTNIAYILKCIAVVGAISWFVFIATEHFFRVSGDFAELSSITEAPLPCGLAVPLPNELMSGTGLRPGGLGRPRTPSDTARSIQLALCAGATVQEALKTLFAAVGHTLNASTSSAEATTEAICAVDAWNLPIYGDPLHRIARAYVRASPAFVQLKSYGVELMGSHHPFPSEGTTCANYNQVGAQLMAAADTAVVYGTAGSLPSPHEMLYRLLALSVVGYSDRASNSGRTFGNTNKKTAQAFCEDVLAAPLFPASDDCTVCQHGVNMFCKDDPKNLIGQYGDYIYYAYGNDGTCHDDFADDRGFRYGHDCADCGGRCCTATDNCATANKDDTSCACYGKAENDAFVTATGAACQASWLPPPPPATVTALVQQNERGFNALYREQPSCPNDAVLNPEELSPPPPPPLPPGMNFPIVSMSTSTDAALAHCIKSLEFGAWDQARLFGMPDFELPMGAVLLSDFTEIGTLLSNLLRTAGYSTPRTASGAETVPTLDLRLYVGYRFAAALVWLTSSFCLAGYLLAFAGVPLVVIVVRRVGVRGQDVLPLHPPAPSNLLLAAALTAVAVLAWMLLVDPLPEVPYVYSASCADYTLSGGPFSSSYHRVDLFIPTLVFAGGAVLGPIYVYALRRVMRPRAPKRFLNGGALLAVLAITLTVLVLLVIQTGRSMQQWVDVATLTNIAVSDVQAAASLVIKDAEVLILSAISWASVVGGLSSRWAIVGKSRLIYVVWAAMVLGGAWAPIVLTSVTLSTELSNARVVDGYRATAWIAVIVASIAMSGVALIAIRGVREEENGQAGAQAPLRTAYRFRRSGTFLAVDDHAIDLVEVETVKGELPQKMPLLALKQ